MTGRWMGREKWRTTASLMPHLEPGLSLLGFEQRSKSKGNGGGGEMEGSAAGGSGGEADVMSVS